MVAIDARDFLNAVTTIHFASTSTVYPGYPCTDKVRHVSDNGSGTVSILHEVCTTSIPTVTHTSYATLGGKCTLKGPEKIQTVKVGDDGHGNDIQQIIENDVTRTTTSFVGQVTAFVCITLGPKEDNDSVKPEEVQDDAPPAPPPASTSTNSVEETSKAGTTTMVTATLESSDSNSQTTAPPPTQTLTDSNSQTTAPPPTQTLTDSIGETSQPATATNSGGGETTKTITRTIPTPVTTTYTAANSDVVREVVSYYSVSGGDGQVGTTTYYETISHYQATKTQVTTTQVSESASQSKRPPRPKSSSKVQKPTTTRSRKPATSEVQKTITTRTRKPATTRTRKPATSKVQKPSAKPTQRPTGKPTAKPTSKPTRKPSPPARPTKRPSRSSSGKPSTKKFSTGRRRTTGKGVKTKTVTSYNSAKTTTVRIRKSTLTTNVKPTRQTTNVRPTRQTTKAKPTRQTTRAKPTRQTTRAKPTRKTTKAKPTRKTTRAKPTMQTTKAKPTMQTTKVKPTKQTTNVKPTTLATSAKPSQHPGGGRCQHKLEKENKLFRLRTHVSGKGSTEFENLYVEETKHDGPNTAPTLSYDRHRGGKFFLDVDTTSVLLSHEKCKFSGVKMYGDRHHDAYSPVFINKEVGTPRMRVTWGSIWWDNDRFDGWVVCRTSDKGGKRYELKWHDAINNMPIDTSKCAKVELLTESLQGA